ncbi:hypothetical protein Y032_0045g1185 [Ancylostoma ceylanicum]|uniref:Uncharacterized protein n=1 Tax=Ancylostoma ceylanicum TaxID=53326 RepID=A0A016UDN6_9BILA|nr:hypothetical protein Y032_0045g1185 [Ancylostoma ceylanicum]
MIAFPCSLIAQSSAVQSMEFVPFTGFRGGTYAHLTAEHLSALSTHEKQLLHFLGFSRLPHHFNTRYEFTVLILLYSLLHLYIATELFSSICIRVEFSGRHFTSSSHLQLHVARFLFLLHLELKANCRICGRKTRTCRRRVSC